MAFKHCVKISPLWVVFALLLIAVVGTAQTPSYVWARSAGAGSDQGGNAVASDASGNVYTTGYIKGTNTFGSISITAAGAEDIFIAKYDENGAIQWAKPAGGNNNDRGLSIAVDNAGNIYVCGYVEGNATFFGSPNITSTGSGDQDIFVAKYNNSGNVLWVKRGSSNNQCRANGICTNGTSVFVTGDFTGTTTFGAFSLTPNGGQDAFIACYNASTGTESWVVKCGSSIMDSGNGIAVDATGVYASGSYDGTISFQNLTGTLTNSGARDIYTVKYDLNGTGIWKRKAGGGGDEQDPCIAVSGAYVYVAGHFSGTMSLFDTGPAVANITAASSDDAFIMQYDATSGNFSWIRSENGSGSDYATGVCIAATGDVFITGYFNGMLPFGSGPSATASSIDIFVTKYNAAGTFQWGKKSGGSDEDYAFGIACPDYPLYITGSYKSTPAGFDLQFISSSSNLDIFTAKIGCTVTTSNAGPNQTVCVSAGATLAGNTPTVGTGLWTLVSGSGTITTPSSPTSTVTAPGAGANVFQWTISTGNCVSSSDQVTITGTPVPTTAAAGADQTICATTATLAGNTATTGTGAWTLISGTGTVTSPASPTSGITGLGIGANVFRWTISNGTCPPSFDEVTITRDANPTASNAGPDQTLCSSVATLAGNTAAIGTGTWTLISGTGTVATPSSPTSTVSGLSVGSNVFRWAISNGTCPVSNDQVTINVDAAPTVANAGSDQTLCAASATFAGNTATVGSGIWTLISGTGTITTPSSPTSTVTGLSVGANVFRWTISNGTCPSTFDEVTITRDANPTTANAGSDQTLCSSSATFTGNIAAIGSGVWTLISGTGTIATPSSPTSTVTGLSVGANVFRWTISNGTCPSTFDEVTITRDANPTTANAGSDQTLCSASATFTGNTASIGNGIWTLISGTGTITTPSSPTSTVTGLGVGANIFRWTISNGTCPSTFDEVTITRDANPTTANAGSDQTICSASATFTGNTASIGNGIWTLISGTGTITTPSSPTSTVTGLSIGANVFRWTISNGTCPSTFDEVIITRDANPTTANAGFDQTLCSASATFTGNTASIGNGIWTLISGTGTITTPSSPTSTVTGLSVGANVFRWTISNGTCPSTFDEVTITRDANPTTANAGSDQTICSASATFTGNTASIGNGTWTLISGTGTIATPSSSTSTVTGLSVGANVFRWTISNGTCPSTFDEVTITRDASPTTANAGSDQTICSASATLAGNTATVGTGAWTLISGTGTIATPSSPTSTVTGLSVGANVFRWTISNGTCPSTFDEVTITRDANPTTANAGSDQTICSASATFTGNTASIGNGTWTLISGTGTIANSSSPTSNVTGLSVGANIFRWTISNGTCPSTFDEVTITRDASPTVATAGNDQTICAASTTMTGNAVIIGNGSWTLISGTGTITTLASPTTGITGLGVGANVFRWTISNGTCPSTFDEVTITRDATPTTANAGSDQTLCSSSTTFTGNNAIIGSGTWTLISGTGAITAPSSPTSTVTGLSVGANIFRWTISNGTCPSTFDEVTITRDANPTTADAGLDQTICSSSSTFTGNTAAIGNGTWTLISGTGTIATPSSPTSTVTGLSVSANVFRWTISNGTCPSTFDEVTITRDATPTVASAGNDQTLCSSSATFAGNTAVIGSGTWTLISGTGTITTPSSPTSTVTGLSVGANIFRWTISNGTCPATFDEVTITRDANPTTADAGLDQIICSTSATFAGNTAAIGNGTWTLISGTGTISTPSSPASTVTGLSVGANVFRWTISNGTCPSTFDEVTITLDANPTVANAGSDQTLCSSSATFAGNSATTGNGTWTLISGTGTIAAPASSTSAVNGLSVGANIFEWTISNGTCPSSSDQVTINVDADPTPANAGPDQTICSSASSLAGNAPSIGTGIWTLISGPAIIAAPSSNTSAVSGMIVGTNVFEWTVSNGTCPSSSDQVTITIDANPTVADAGTDQTICATATTLAGNIAATGNGTWTLISGTGTLASPASEASTVNGLSVGTNIFEWTITNGTCPASSDQVTINVDANPSVANAGADQTICSATGLCGASIPLTGNGTWNVISGTGVITVPSQATSGITNLATGTNSFEWVITNGVCPASHDTFLIFVDENPTAANAGNNQQICSSSSVMNGSIPLTGTGTWNTISSTANFSDATVNNTQVTNLATGINTLEWVITNGTCAASRDTVVILVDAFPSVAAAGADQLLCVSTSTLQAANPSTGSGAWFVIAGTGIVSNTALPNSPVTTLSDGANDFKWVVTNGVCPVSVDTVRIFIDTLPTVANAGIQQTICSNVSSLSGNAPLIGSGQWLTVGGSAAISNASQSSTAVSNLAVGANTFEWVITNGVCPASRDTIVINVDANPSSANAGSDVAICDPFETLSANVPLTGNGTWNVINGPSSVANPNSAATTVNNLAAGSNAFEWVIANGTCPATRDTVNVLYTLRPSAPDAGQDIFACSYNVTMQAAVPSIGIGYWTNVSNTGILADTSNPSSALSNLPDGSHLYTWTTTNAYCIAPADTVVVTVYSPPSLAEAGPDQLVHTTFATLNAVACDTGTGTWAFVSGTGTIENANDPFTRITNLANGMNVLRWTTSNGVCTTTYDDVRIESKQLIIPTGYSPNGDGTNDNFEIEGLLEYQNVSLEVFNRWGNQVFLSGDYRNDWNGNATGGELLPDDIYYYVLKLSDGTAFTGYVSLKRRTQ